MRTCFWYDPYCQKWWEERETERENGIEGDWTYCISNGTYISSAKCHLNVEDNLGEVMNLSNGTGVFYRYKASEWWELEQKRAEWAKEREGKW